VRCDLIKAAGTLGAARAPAATWADAPADDAPVNARFFDAAARDDARRGAESLALLRLPAGSTLYRIGNSGARHRNDNFGAPWWLRPQELQQILRKGQRDTAWAARVMLAIAEAFGSRCDWQVSVQTRCELQGWLGVGKALSVQGRAVMPDDADAYWIPEPGLLQLYIPGLRRVLPGGSSALWTHAFGARQIVDWLPIGTQANLATGRPYSGSPLPAGRRDPAT
jgi:hypothetical protein